MAASEPYGKTKKIKSQCLIIFFRLYSNLYPLSIKGEKQKKKSEPNCPNTSEIKTARTVSFTEIQVSF